MLFIPPITEHFLDFSPLIQSKAKTFLWWGGKNHEKAISNFRYHSIGSGFVNQFSYARKWNNPENQRRFNQAQTRAAETYRNESKAWQNYDRELASAQKDVRRVRDGAINGVIKGGPAGAAWGAAGPGYLCPGPSLSRLYPQDCLWAGDIRWAASNWKGTRAVWILERATGWQASLLWGIKSLL
jgi:hypothetical protein